MTALSHPGRRVISHHGVSASARASLMNDFQRCGLLSRMWYSLGPVLHSALHAFVALLRGNLLVSGLRQYYPGLPATVACRIKVYCLVGVVLSLARSAYDASNFKPSMYIACTFIFIRLSLLLGTLSPQIC